MCRKELLVFHESFKDLVIISILFKITLFHIIIFYFTGVSNNAYSPLKKKFLKIGIVKYVIRQ